MTEKIKQTETEDQVLETGEITAQEAAKTLTTDEREGRKPIKPSILKPEPLAVKPVNPSDEVSEGNISDNISVRDEKKYTVLVKKYVKCKIGPVWYEFKAGQKYNVTENVKEILKKQNLLEVI